MAMRFLRLFAVGDAQLKDIKTWNPVASEFTAKKENAEIYRRHYEVFREPL